MELMERAFKRMGARVTFAELNTRSRAGNRIVSEDLALDVREDGEGEYFLISRPASSTELIVLDVQAELKHLLLLSRNGTEKHRYLLGHDERHWFVAGIPERNLVSRVRDAMNALKPEAVLENERGLRSKLRQRRSNAARVRQGEWFFIPAPHAHVEKFMILHNEPLVRSGGGKPHVCEELYRFGGETVYVKYGSRQVLSEPQYRALSEGKRTGGRWRLMRRNPRVFVRGRVRHLDHKTVFLDGWHEVFSNTENLSQAMRNVVFLD
ncbi:MAG TPA: hypothetical protein VKW78_11930 [Terriglobales bacterium]|nr:hypothetical protein [Terriglobales bacterium]